MTKTVEALVNSFESLSDSEKRDALAEIVRRAGHLDYSCLDDETIAQITDERFLELDREEESQ